MSSLISPYAVTSALGNSLNFGQAGAGAGMFQNAGNNQSLANNYANSYKGALSLNSDLYQGVLSGYNQTTSDQAARQGQIQAGFGTLDQNVQRMLGLGGTGAVGAGGVIDWSKVDPTKGASGIGEGSFGIGTGAARAIANTMTSNRGQIASQMASAGLGNTSALGNAYQQNSFQGQEALGDLGDKLAQTGAGYAANIGLASLNYANQANMQNTAQKDLALKFMGDTHIPYPNTQAYGSLYGGNLARNAAAVGRTGGAVVNPFGSASSGSQGHIPFSAGNSMPSPPGAQGMQQNTAGVISRALSTGANSTAASYGMSTGDYNNWIATGSPTDENGNPVDSYGNQLQNNQYTDNSGGGGAAAAYSDSGGGGEF